MLWRVYYQLRLNLTRRGKKRLPAPIKLPLQAASQPNQGWNCNFMSDALWSGRRFRTFNVIDEYNQENLRRTLMSNDSPRPTEPRYWTTTSSIH